MQTTLARTEYSKLPNNASVFWSYRILAAIIDATVLGASQMALLMLGMSGCFILLPLLTVSQAGSVKSFVLCFFVSLVAAAQVLSFLYQYVQECSRYQSTLGQRQFGFIVADADVGSSKLSLRRSLWRFFVSPLSILLLINTIFFALLPLMSATLLAVNFSFTLMIVMTLVIVAVCDALVCQVQTGVPANWAFTTVPTIISTATSRLKDELFIRTKRGKINARAYFGQGNRHAVVVVGGCGTGHGSPARGLYHYMAKSLRQEGVTTLWLRFRKPAELEEGIHDLRAAVHYLAMNGFSNIVLVGHSFGGAAVISAAAFEVNVSGVITVSSQNACTELVSDIAPRPVLIIHGTHDRVIPLRLAEDIFNRALPSKELRLFAGGHSLREAAPDVFNCMSDWLRGHFSPVV